MSTMTYRTISDLPAELIYTILSQRLADILFNYLFVDSLVGLNTDKDIDSREEEDPIPAVQPTNNRLVEIGSLGGVCVAWHIVLTRILRAVVNLNPNLDDHAPSLVTASQLMRRCPTYTPSLDALVGSFSINGFKQGFPEGSLQNSHTSAVALVHGMRECCQSLRSMQTSLRKLVQQTTDHHRFEQQLNSAGVTTPTLMAMGPITPPHSTPALPSVEQTNFPLNLSLASEYPYYSLPIFQSALYHTQASLLVCPNNSGRRQDLSLTLSTTNLSNTLRMLRNNTSIQAICPREISLVAQNGASETEARLKRALEVCEWKDLLERVFLRGDRGEEVTQRIHYCFEQMEQQSESLDLHYLVRGGLFRIVQLISRLDLISLESETNTDPTSSSSTNWKERASALTFCWTGRVIEWTGF